MSFTAADSQQPWQGIAFQGAGASASRLENCRIEGASGINAGNARSVVYIENAAPTITGCTLNGAGTGQHGIWVYSGDATLTNNTLSGFPGTGIWINSGAPTVTGNTLSGSGTGIRIEGGGGGLYQNNRLTDNTVGISVSYSNHNPVVGANSYARNAQADMIADGTITTAAGWDDPGSTTYQVGSLTVAAGTRLTIGTGRTLKFGANGTLWVNGALTASGVSFTAADSQQPWQGIAFQGAGASASRLENCRIEGASGINAGNARSVVYIENAAPTITGCTVNGIGNDSYGIWVNGNATITNNTLSGFGNGKAIWVAGGSPTVTGNTIIGNSNMLSVNRIGTGTGTVISNPAGIDCGATCAASFTSGASVTLSATADTGSSFAGWSGAGCSGTGSCIVTMDAAKTVTATFTAVAPTSYALTVSKTGTGNGTVTGPGIDCGSDCTENYTSGTSVTLSATADTGSSFAGWSGAGCSGTGSCSVTMDAAQSVTATFNTLTEVRPETISAGDFYTCGLKGDGTVACWGIGYFGETTPPAGTFTQLSAGGFHTCGLKTDGTVACWGAGAANTGYPYGQATPLPGTFTQVSAGYLHTCGVKSDGTVACWGAGTTNAASSPNYGQAIPPAGIFTQVSAGYWHTCGLKTDGTVACWGDNENDRATPPAGTFTQLSAGNFHTCGVKTDGIVACWGYNHEGQATPPTGAFLQVSAGGYHTCGVQTDGTVACWGAGTTVTGSDPDYGQALPPSDLFTELSAGQYHTCGVKSDGAVTCWGDNRYGQLGPTLTVTKAGNGTGTVTSDPAGIDCGDTCTTTYPPLTATAVTLTAAPTSGSTFTGWSGACSGVSICTVTVDTAKTVTATFNTGAPTTYLLTVSKAGTGDGKVTGKGIKCGNDCTETYASGTTVTLTATVTTGSTFAGWSGACTGTAATCTVTMTAAQNVTATFTQPVLTVTKAGSGAGTVASRPAGINCGDDCSEPYKLNTTVTLIATPANGSAFTGWSGCTPLETNPRRCTVEMSADQTVTAIFTPLPVLTVTKAGSGAGTVASRPAGINCGDDCSEPYKLNTTVTLIATPANGSAFTGWSGCTPLETNPRRCTVEMSADQTVTAIFTPLPVLTVTKAGSGAGTVASRPAGINCGDDCSEPYKLNTTVTLIATPANGSAFTGWSGCTPLETNPRRCTVEMSADQTVTAIFNTTTLGTYAPTPTLYKTSMGLDAVASSPVRDTYDPNPIVIPVSITSNGPG